MSLLSFGEAVTHGVAVDPEQLLYRYTNNRSAHTGNSVFPKIITCNIFLTAGHCDKMSEKRLYCH